MAYLTQQPALGLLPFAVLLGLYLRSSRRLVLLAALAWACYVPYEYGMTLRLLCSGECNIRLDLLLIYATLVLWSIAAVVIGLRASRRRTL